VAAALVVEGQHDEVIGNARDVSVGGMFVETREAVPFGARVVVRIRLRDEPMLKMPATVRWVSVDGVGVQFGLLGARETHAITQLVARATTLAPSSSSKRRRVLIVDDSEDSAEMVKLILEERGHVTRVAHDGTHALEACAEFRPDLVFLDIGLPGMNGYEVVARMREMPAGATIPIIALTGYAGEPRAGAPYAAGFSEHLTKPVEPSLLGEIVDACGPSP
jgi:CheY-like chemotaxis protein